MKIQRLQLTPIMLLIAWGSSSSCSSGCAPVNSGGVVVNVTGVSSCDTVTITATDGSNQYGFDATTASDVDGGAACEFQGLTGHPGTFAVNLSINGHSVASQSLTLEKLDDCNASATMITFDATDT